MLEVDYPTRFGELIRSIEFDIELPIEWAEYFEEKGEVTSFSQDQRTNQRLKVRTHGLLIFEQSLPFLSREESPVGVYTRDFSRHGCGFLTPFQLFPEERVRIILPTFWVRLHVVRTRRITSKCFEVGSSLLTRHDPAAEAFDPNAGVAFSPECS